MKRSEVIEFFGSAIELARVMGITTQAIYQWPDELPERLATEVIGHSVREMGPTATKRAFPEFF